MHSTRASAKTPSISPGRTMPSTPPRCALPSIASPTWRQKTTSALRGNRRAADAHSELHCGAARVAFRIVKTLSLCLLVLAICTASIFAADQKAMKDHPASEKAAATQRITFGGGCFWCMEAVFQRLKGVKSVVSGYAGGDVPNPTYHQVCTGDTGHAEVVQLEYDPAEVSFETLLTVFWAAHDPTTLNRQGGDHGTQYRSVIFYENDAQKAAAEKSKAAAQPEFKD